MTSLRARLLCHPPITYIPRLFISGYEVWMFSLHLRATSAGTYTTRQLCEKGRKKNHGMRGSCLFDEEHVILGGVVAPHRSNLGMDAGAVIGVESLLAR